MHPEWVDLQDHATWRPLLRNLEREQIATLLSAIVAAPDSEHWAKAREVIVSPPAGATGYLVPSTRVFLDMKAIRQWNGDIVILAAAFLVSQNLTLAAVLTTLRKLYAAISQLSADEAELVGVIKGLSRGANPYAVAVSEDAVRAAYEGATVDVNQLLDSLESKQVVRRVRIGKLRLVY